MKTAELSCAMLVLFVSLVQASSIVSWGESKRNLKIGWEVTQHSVHVLEPFSLYVHLRLASQGQPVSIRPTNTELMYSIRVVFGPKGRAVNLTEEGKRRFDPMNSLGISGSVLDYLSVKRDEIPLTRWWDMTTPGNYQVFVSYALKGSGNENEVLSAPVFNLAVVK